MEIYSCLELPLHVTIETMERQLKPTDLLRSHLVRSLVLVVDAAEVGDDDGDGQSNHQHAAQGADGAEDLPGDGVGNHVTVAARGRDTCVKNQNSTNCQHEQEKTTELQLIQKPSKS